MLGQTGLQSFRICKTIIRNVARHFYIFQSIFSSFFFTTRGHFFWVFNNRLGLAGYWFVFLLYIRHFFVIFYRIQKRDFSLLLRLWSCTTKCVFDDRRIRVYLSLAASRSQAGGVQVQGVRYPIRAMSRTHQTWASTTKNYKTIEMITLY